MYYIIHFIEEKRNKELIVEPYNLMPGMIDIKTRDSKILYIEDCNEKRYSIDEICKIEKERLDVLYNEINNIDEAYYIAKKYFDKLLRWKLLYKKEYDVFVDKLNKFKEDNNNNLEQFKEDVKDLYIIKA